jgi:FMN phosphatase YigB (HAD superfamily)
MDPGEISALTFDVFGTVVDWRSSIARELRGFFGPRGIERKWEAVADRWRALYQPAMEEVRRGPARGSGSMTCIARTLRSCSMSSASPDCRTTRSGI